ncbi:MAG: hypothetical protein K8F26_12680 [Thiobacillus sp.]|jgi:hypothetical protein|nr:hypothetical protein [Thiobacillus sp.]
MSLHLELGSAIDAAFEDHLDAPVEQKQDAMIVRLKNGVVLNVRYAAADAYSLRWAYGDAESGIDTAPLHRDLATFPNHFHEAGGRVMADPITRPDASPADNLQNLIRALIDDPMLGARDLA